MPERKFKVAFILFIFAFQLLSQKSGFFNPIRLWVISHPFAAYKIKKLNHQCTIIYNQKEISQRLDSFSNGGKLDAFRHVFFMAAFSQKVKQKKLRKLGIAHENQNYRQFLKKESMNFWRHDSLAMVMDLFNNELAFKLGQSFNHLKLDFLKEKVIISITGGEAIIFKRNNKGQFLKCDGTLLMQEEIGNGWFVPKCLVKSDFNYSD